MKEDFLRDSSLGLRTPVTSTIRLEGSVFVLRKDKGTYSTFYTRGVALKIKMRGRSSSLKEMGMNHARHEPFLFLLHNNFTLLNAELNYI
jgi:hypothetical protein